MKDLKKILNKTAFELMFGFNPSRNDLESRERARKQRLKKKKKEND